MIQFDPTFSTLIAFYLSPVMLGVAICIGVFILLAGLLERYSHSNFMLSFDILYEKIHNFYWDILGPDSSSNVKVYIVTLFFVILVANLAAVLLDFIAPVFGMSAAGDFHLMQYITMPTWDMQFNIALSLFSTLLLLYVQFGSLGFKKFFYNYLPVWGKGYIVVPRENMKAYVYYPIATVAKVWDIVISLFLGFLDIVGLFAKVISLAFRLFWNMTSGTILLWMLIVGTTALSNSLTGFVGWINLPIILPVLVYLQEILVACIQAMVFPLLVAIFIRMAQMETA